MTILNRLNEAQREAVTTTEGYVRVIAGAGSGKTKALTNRYIYLVKELGISTSNILCVTFTNKAAREMKKRIRAVIGDNDTGLISTFHGFCRLLLKEDIHTMGYPDNFIVMDTEDVESILNNSGYEAMLRESGEDERLDNLAELKNSVTDYENNAGEEATLEDYLQEISLYTNTDVQDNKDTVKMMTLLTAKGSEFPYVFICGLNEGIFPSEKTDTIEKMEEERRLAYGGYTRAENALFLSDAEGMNFNGNYRYPSRFIFNTEKTYLNYTVELEENLINDANDFIANSENSINVVNTIRFIVGEKIQHKSFVTGRIIEVDNNNSSYVIKFDNSETHRNISFSAQLEKADTDDSEIESINEQQKETVAMEEQLAKEDRIEKERLEAERIEKEKPEARKANFRK
ncbi:UvrD-helicase domain-containing protein [Clostridium sp. YIM B02555]|uniref:UvrD-helicase domain-containing protein n=1 Tax=Clostridium sp. YIM B02555 TaxID=2911968 RepID=UPI001EED169F|nr:UvrD-helicase domain-containing protein [Clostridium sp. YIM B02555]